MYDRGQAVLELLAALQEEEEATHQDESVEAALDLPPARALVQQAEARCWARRWARRAAGRPVDAALHLHSPVVHGAGHRAAPALVQLWRQAPWAPRAVGEPSRRRVGGGS